MHGSLSAHPFSPAHSPAASFVSNINRYQSCNTEYSSLVGHHHRRLLSFLPTVLRSLHISIGASLSSFYHIPVRAGLPNTRPRRLLRTDVWSSSAQELTSHQSQFSLSLPHSNTITPDSVPQPALTLRPEAAMHNLATLTLFLTAVGLTHTQQIQPSSVPMAIRDSWCSDQQSSCPLLCLQQTNTASTRSNTCSPSTLAWTCVCTDGTSPNVSEYSQTVPFYECQEAGNQCVTGCGQSSSCATDCRYVSTSPLPFPLLLWAVPSSCEKAKC